MATRPCCSAPLSAGRSRGCARACQGVSHSKLAAAVTNGGGIGVIGGLTMSPDELRSQIADIKANLTDKNGNFGVDLAIPQVGGNARKTNHDYT